MSLRTRKRSFKRASRRAVRDGVAWYRGRQLTRVEVAKQQPELVSKLVTKSVSSGSFPCSAPQAAPRHKFKQGQAARADRTQFLSWNAGGLSSETFDMLVSLLVSRKIMVAHIQETHWSFSSTWTTDVFHCIHTGSDKPGTAGCLTMVHKDLCRSSQIKYQFVVPGRLLHVRVLVRDSFLNLVNIYQYFVQKPHHDDQQSFQRTIVLHELDNVIHSIPCRHLLLIGGDFNAKLRPHGSWVGRAVGLCSAPADEELLAILEKHDLLAVNTWGPTCSYSNCFAGHRSLIDFVLLRRQHVDSRAKQVAYLYSHPLQPPRPSFHVPMVLSFASLWRCWAHPAGGSQCRKPDTDSFLADTATQAPRYHLFLSRLRSVLEQGDQHDLDIDSAVHTLALEMYPPKSVEHKLSVQEALTSQIRTGWKLWAQLRRLHSYSLHGMFHGWSLVARLLRHRRNHRKAHRQVRRTRLASLMNEASQAAKSGDQRVLHKLVRLLSPKQKKIKLQLRNSLGYLMTDEEEAIQIRDHMYKLYVREGAEDLTPKYCQHLPFDEVGLYQSMLDLPARKSCPPGFAASAFVKHAAAVVAPVLFRRLKVAWENNHASIPRNWRLSWLCWIPKPYKNQASMSGWRGISLQSVIGKAVLRSVERTTRDACDASMRKAPQYAYTKSRGTGDAIARALLHQSEAMHKGKATNITIHDRKAGREKNKLGGGLQVCLDINQAFDRVPRKQLMQSAVTLGVAQDQLSILNNWHIDTEYVSPTSGDDVSVMANSGVRQGCVAAPSLWNMFIHGFLEKMAKVFSWSWIQEHVTIYADDFHIFFAFDSEEAFQKALLDLRRFLDELMLYDLDLNMDKTVVLLELKGSRSQKWRKKVVRKEGSSMVLRLDALDRPNPPLLLRLVRSHKYLGIMLSYRHCQDETWTLRRNAASATFARLRKWWSSAFPLRERVKLWFQTVWPTLTYGLLEVGLSKRGIQRFSAFVMKHLRILAKSPRGEGCELNVALLSRLSLSNPLDKLCLAVFQLWKRREMIASRASGDDILKGYPRLCQRASEYKHLLWHWWSSCLPIWQRLEIHQTDDGVDDSLLSMLGVQEISAEPVPASECTTLATRFAENHVCGECQASFPHQMALRIHMRSLHGIVAEAKFRFRMELDSLEGLPTCRHCGFVFR